jgi:hypothetical protein
MTDSPAATVRAGPSPHLVSFFSPPSLSLKRRCETETRSNPRSAAWFKPPTGPRVRRAGGVTGAQWNGPEDGPGASMHTTCTKFSILYRRWRGLACRAAVICDYIQRKKHVPCQVPTRKPRRLNIQSSGAARGHAPDAGGTSGLTAPVKLAHLQPPADPGTSSTARHHGDKSL